MPQKSRKRPPPRTGHGRRTSRPWTASEDAAVVEMRRAKRPAAEIAARLKRTVAAVVTRLVFLKVTIRPKSPPWTPEEDARLFDMRIKGVKTYTIGRRLGRTPAAVVNRTSLLGLPGRRACPARPAGRLVAQVRPLHALGLNDVEIAARLDLASAVSVFDARRRAGLPANIDPVKAGRKSGAVRRANRAARESQAPARSPL